MIVANRMCQAYPLKWNSEVFPVDKWASPLLELAHSKIESAMQNDKTYRKHVKCQNIIHRLTKWNSIQHHNRICIGIKTPITLHREGAGLKWISWFRSLAVLRSNLMLRKPQKEFKLHSNAQLCLRISELLIQDGERIIIHHSSFNTLLVHPSCVSAYLSR